MGLGVENDIVQELSDRTAIGSVRAHFSASTSGATFDGTTDWADLGALNPGSPAFDFGQTVTDVPTGSPSTIKARHIASYAGSISFDVIDYSDNAFNLSVGTTLTSAYVPATVAAANTTVNTTPVSTRQVVALYTVANIAPGDRLVFNLGTNFPFKESRQVDAVDTGASTVTLQGFLSEAPSTGTAVSKIARVTNVIGGNKLRNYQLRVIASFDDDSFMVIHSQKGNFASGTKPNYEDGANIVKLPMMFGLIGVAEQIAGFTAKQVVLARHHAFYPAST